MKKHERKKLALNRETVRNLEKLELKKVAGGLAYIAPIVSSDNEDCTYSRACQDTW